MAWCWALYVLCGANFARAQEGVIAVYGVSDEELIRLKLERPADMARLAIAGDEQLVVLSQSQTQDALFFGGESGRLGPVVFSDRRHASLHAWLWASHLFYMMAVTSGSLDETIDRVSAREVDVLERDLLGLDFTAWARDIHRPREAYEARGAHPTGVGVQRYVKWSELTDEEQRYLKQRRSMHVLNVINPALFNIRGFALGEEVMMSAALVHQLAPFGYDLGVSARVMAGDLKLAAWLHGYVSERGVHPGLALVEWPSEVLGQRVYWTPRLGGWIQPDELLYRAQDASLGAMWGLMRR
jgi:hypothetical protein